MGKTLFLLGAGFSKWLSHFMPLLKDLYNSLSTELLDEIKKNKLNSLLNENSLELLMSYLITKYPWKNDEEYYNNLSLYFAIEKQIVKTITELQNKALENFEYNKQIDKLIRYWVDKNSNIITFNYDTLIETLIYEKIEKRDWFDFWKIPIQEIHDRSQTGVFGNSDDAYNKNKSLILITKLHGSINWYRSEKFPEKNETIYYLYRYKTSYNVEINLRGLKSFIIPPTISKEYFLEHEIISIMWERARYQISESDNIVIIGYSFPESDAYINLLFASSLKFNTNIFIVNRNNTIEFKNKIKKYFMNYIDINKLNLEFCGKENSISSFIDEKLN